MLLELVELKFKGIGRFLEEQIVHFNSLSAFVQVDGQNNNTGGSSGSGKTTVFNALDYLLGLNSTPATVLQCRYTKEPIWVQGRFIWLGEEITITRSISLFKIEGKLFQKVIKGSAAEEKLDEILGMPRDLFRKIVHKRQDEGGFFINLTPKQMHDFLMDCIGLSKFKAKYEIVDNEISFLNEKLSTTSSNMKSRQASLSATQDAILAVGLPPIQDIHKEVILELKTKYDKSVLRFNEIKQRCDLEYQDHAAKRPNINDNQYDGEILEDLERQARSVELEIVTQLQEESDRQGRVKKEINDKKSQMGDIIRRLNDSVIAKEKAIKIAEEIKHIRSKKCPTCEQDWSSESSANLEKEKLAELVKLKEIIIIDGTEMRNAANTLQEEAVALEPSLSYPKDFEEKSQALGDRRSKLSQKIIEEKRKAKEFYERQGTENKKLLNEFSAKQEELSKRHSIEVDQVRGQMDVDRRVLDVAVQKLKSYEEAKHRYLSTFAELKKKEEIFTKAIEECRVENEKFTRKLIFAEESKKAIKTYVSFSFDDALDAISDKATKIIRCIPNMNSATIQFEGTKETQQGKVKEEVNAVISMDGEIGIPIKSLSGGERSALDLAIDLAVIDYIETKTGKGLNIFILDEPFRGLGTVEIEMALEVLKNANTNKKLIIVDHNPEVKQMVQSRLVVVRDGLTSGMAS